MGTHLRNLIARPCSLFWLFTALKCRGCCTSLPLPAQREPLVQISRSGALQLRWEVSTWEGVCYVTLFPVIVELGATAATQWKSPGMRLWQLTPPDTGHSWDTWPVVASSFQLGIIGRDFWKGVFQLWGKPGVCWMLLLWKIPILKYQIDE